MKTPAHQLITAGVLLGTATILLITWGVTLYKQKIGVSMMTQSSRSMRTAPRQQLRTESIQIITKPATKRVCGYEISGKIENRIVENFAEMEKARQQHENTMHEKQIELQIMQKKYEQERVAKVNLAQKQKQRKRDRFLRLKQTLFDMNILTPEEWGSFVTGNDPITKHIKDLLKSKSELTDQDYEEINGKVKELGRYAEIVRSNQEEVARMAARREAKRLKADLKKAEAAKLAEASETEKPLGVTTLLSSSTSSSTSDDEAE